jgi:hypothetical protein
MSQDAGIDIDFDTDPAGLDRELARIQAQGAAAGQEEGSPAKVVAGKVIEAGDTVEFMGRKFRIADKIGLMPLLKFSTYADVAVSDPKALAAMYAMLRDCIHPGGPGCGKDDCIQCQAGNEQACPDREDKGDWDAFERHAMDTRADAEELFKVITDTMELIAGRPTGPSSPSSPGRRGISAGSTARSSARRGKGPKR